MILESIDQNSSWTQPVLKSAAPGPADSRLPQDRLEESPLEDLDQTKNVQSHLKDSKKEKEVKTSRIPAHSVTLANPFRDPRTRTAREKLHREDKGK